MENLKDLIGHNQKNLAIVASVVGIVGFLFYLKDRGKSVAPVATSTALPVQPSGSSNNSAQILDISNQIAANSKADADLASQVSETFTGVQSYLSALSTETGNKFSALATGTEQSINNARAELASYTNQSIEAEALLRGQAIDKATSAIEQVKATWDNRAIISRNVDLGYDKEQSNIRESLISTSGGKSGSAAFKGFGFSIGGGGGSNSTNSEQRSSDASSKLGYTLGLHDTIESSNPELLRLFLNQSAPLDLISGFDRATAN